MKSFTIQIELDSVRFFNFFLLDFTIVTRENVFEPISFSQVTKFSK